LPQASLDDGPVIAKTSEGKAAEVERLIAPSLEAMGYEIVRVLLSGERRAKLQVMAERRDGNGMTIDDCAALSRAVEAILDVEDPIHGAYVLEASSPGLDRPLTRLGDFDRFAGLEAKVELQRPRDGRRRFRGQLRGRQGVTVLIETEDGVLDLDFDNIVKAKLVPGDDVIAASRKAANS